MANLTNSNKRKADELLDVGANGLSNDTGNKPGGSGVRKPRKKRKLDVPKENLMMKLPGELRNKIYEFALVDDRILYIQPRGSRVSSYNPKRPPKRVTRESLAACRGNENPKLRRRERSCIPGILQASRQIRQEAMSIYFSCNRICFAFADAKSDAAVTWLDALHGLNLLLPNKRRIHFCITKMNKEGRLGRLELEDFIRFTDLGMRDEDTEIQFWTGMISHGVDTSVPYRLNFLSRIEKGINVKVKLGRGGAAVKRASKTQRALRKL